MMGLFRRAAPKTKNPLDVVLSKSLAPRVLASLLPGETVTGIIPGEKGSGIVITPTRLIVAKHTRNSGEVVTAWDRASITGVGVQVFKVDGYVVLETPAATTRGQHEFASVRLDLANSTTTIRFDKKNLPAVEAAVRALNAQLHDVSR